MNLVKPREIANRYDIPYQNIIRWAKEKNTWRRKLYDHLQKCYVRELAEKAKEMKL